MANRRSSNFVTGHRADAHRHAGRKNADPLAADHRAAGLRAFAPGLYADTRHCVSRILVAQHGCAPSRRLAWRERDPADLPQLRI